MRGTKFKDGQNGNDNPTSSSIKDLTGIIPAGGFYILVPGNGSGFEAAYGFAANQVIGNGGAADSNGDDQIAITNSAGDIVDIFGVPGEDGTGTAHDFEDGRAERAATITTGSATWVAAEWNVVTGGVDAPAGFDPGAWIGHQTNPSSPYAHAWMLNPAPGAMVVSSGENATGSIWWSSSQGDVTTRACLFDDKFVMHSDGSFDNDMGTETWLEGWQGVSEGCGSPVAPHNNSNDASWVLNETDMTITLNGVGAYFALAKAVNGAELTGVDDAVPHPEHMIFCHLMEIL